MASSKDYLGFVLEQLSGIDGVSYRPMMGEYIFYYRGKVIGGIFDDRFLIKPVPSAKKLMPSATYETPYEGGKDMLLVDRIDDRPFLKELFEAVYDELPAPTEKKRKAAGKNGK